MTQCHLIRRRGEVTQSWNAKRYVTVFHILRNVMQIFVAKWRRVLLISSAIWRKFLVWYQTLSYLLRLNLEQFCCTSLSQLHLSIPKGQGTGSYGALYRCKYGIQTSSSWALIRLQMSYLILTISCSNLPDPT